jgi:hypothetical protein
MTSRMRKNREKEVKDWKLCWTIISDCGKMKRLIL